MKGFKPWNERCSANAFSAAEYACHACQGGAARSSMIHVAALPPRACLSCAIPDGRQRSRLRFRIIYTRRLLVLRTGGLLVYSKAGATTSKDIFRVGQAQLRTSDKKSAGCSVEVYSGPDTAPSFFLFADRAERDQFVEVAAQNPSTRRRKPNAAQSHTQRCPWAARVQVFASCACAAAEGEASAASAERAGGDDTRPSANATQQRRVAAVFAPLREHDRGFPERLRLRCLSTLSPRCHFWPAAGSREGAAG